MLMLSSISPDIFARCANALTDRESEEILNDSIARIIVEIRERARQARQSEKNYVQDNKIREDELKRVAQEESKRHEKSIQEGQERNRQLAQAESTPTRPDFWPEDY